jgi:hypothetical protein
MLNKIIVTISNIVQSFVFGLWLINYRLIYAYVLIVHLVFPGVFFQHFFDLFLRKFADSVVFNIFQN